MVRGRVKVSEKLNLDKVITHPFTGLYWDYQTKSYMFFICGFLVVQLSLNGDILYSVKKEIVVH